MVRPYRGNSKPVMAQIETMYHEVVHSSLSPKFRLFRQFRAGLKASGYWRPAMLQFLEEALAETYSVLKTRGFLAAIRAATFPVSNGYVTVAQLAAEETRVRTIALVGGNYGVFWYSSPPAGMPRVP